MYIIIPIVFSICIMCVFPKSILSHISDRFNISKSTLSYSKVISKQDKEAYFDKGVHGAICSLSGGELFAACRITFEFENKKTAQLEVSRKIYNSLSVGSSGVLAYDGDEFKNFYVGKTLEDMNTIEKR